MTERKQDCLTIGLSPAIQKTLVFDKFKLGEINRSLYYHTHASGKCVNVCRVLTQAGLNSSCLTITGRENIKEFENLCKRDSIRLINVVTNGRTRTCTTLVGIKDKKISELIVNEPESISSSDEEEFKHAFQKCLLKKWKSAIISGSKIKGFSKEIIPYIVKNLKEADILLFADYRGNDLINSLISKRIRPDYIKINEEEFIETFGKCRNMEKKIRALSLKYENTLIISRGANSTMVGDNGDFFLLKNISVDIINTIGSGDSMIAGLADGIINGSSLKNALIKGRDYAARNAQSVQPGWILNT